MSTCGPRREQRRDGQSPPYLPVNSPVIASSYENNARLETAAEQQARRIEEFSRKLGQTDAAAESTIQTTGPMIAGEQARKPEDLFKKRYHATRTSIATSRPILAAHGQSRDGRHRSGMVPNEQTIDACLYRADAQLPHAVKPLYDESISKVQGTSTNRQVEKVKD
jgi:hypothetical protein